MDGNMWSVGNLALWHELITLARMSILLDRIRELLDEVPNPPPALSDTYWFVMDKWNDEFQGFLEECEVGMVANGTIADYQRWKGLDQDANPLRKPDGAA